MQNINLDFYKVFINSINKVIYYKILYKVIFIITNKNYQFQAFIFELWNCAHGDCTKLFALISTPSSYISEIFAVPSYLIY